MNKFNESNKLRKVQYILLAFACILIMAFVLFYRPTNQDIENALIKKEECQLVCIQYSNYFDSENSHLFENVYGYMTNDDYEAYYNNELGDTFLLYDAYENGKVMEMEVQKIVNISIKEEYQFLMESFSQSK